MAGGPGAPSPSATTTALTISHHPPSWPLVEMGSMPELTAGVCLKHILGWQKDTIVKSSLVQVRVDQETKQDADALFSDLGMDTATAVRIFLRQAIQTRSLPFEVRQQPRYNATTEAAIAEGDAISEGLTEAPTYATWESFEASLEEE
jgi:DNA-damage-inducible protein J